MHKIKTLKNIALVAVVTKFLQCNKVCHFYVKAFFSPPAAFFNWKPSGSVDLKVTSIGNYVRIAKYVSKSTMSDVETEF